MPIDQCQRAATITHVDHAGLPLTGEAEEPRVSALSHRSEAECGACVHEGLIRLRFVTPHVVVRGAQDGDVNDGINKQALGPNRGLLLKRAQEFFVRPFLWKRRGMWRREGGQTGRRRDHESAYSWPGSHEKASTLSHSDDGRRR